MKNKPEVFYYEIQIHRTDPARGSEAPKRPVQTNPGDRRTGAAAVRDD